MEITVTRVDGAMAINPVPEYLTDYLQYSHRSFGFQGYRKVNKYDKKLLFSVQPAGGIVTFSGFYEKVLQLIERHDDTVKVSDLRSTIGEPNLEAVADIHWEGIESTGLREYQIDPVVEFLYKAKDNNGVCCAAGG